MRHNTIIDRVSIDFIDGHLHCAIREIIDSGDINETGLYAYYADRVMQRVGGLLEYEGALAHYVLDNCRGKRVVEIGAGLGELPITIALNGLTAAAVEYDSKRILGATKIREAMIRSFPELAERYVIVPLGFPEALVESAWAGPDVTLLFTNVGSGWDDKRTEEGISRFHSVGEVILDLRLFGAVRDEAEQRALFERIGAEARTAELLPEIASSPASYAHFTFEGRVAMSERLNRLKKTYAGAVMNALSAKSP
jgi:hypothetical protein